MQNKITHEFFEKEKLIALKKQSPFFVFSKESLLNNFKQYKKCFPPQTEICYAVKANSEKIVLHELNKINSSFEVASKYELALLKKLNVNPDRIIFGSSVKPENHIAEFSEYGIDRFAFDSEEELLKIARHAPNARVFLRVLLDTTSESVFKMYEKFGANLKDTIPLLQKAKQLGLTPYGISFNVGSQAKNKNAWANGITKLTKTLSQLADVGIKLQTINLGGGFPHSYQQGDGFPNINQITENILKAIKELPYTVKFLIEPGRGLVANVFVLVTSVIAKTKRANGHWLFVDAGIYNALMEALIFQGSTQYKIELLSSKNISTAKKNFIITGPTGDNLDVINKEVELPQDINVGDKLLIHDTGAYTTTLATNFNGFPKPKVITL